MELEQEKLRTCGFCLLFFFEIEFVSKEIHLLEIINMVKTSGIELVIFDKKKFAVKSYYYYRQNAGSYKIHFFGAAVEINL